MINTAISSMGGKRWQIGEDMFGVVLWSDQLRNRAVIWCEDHGDLAFYNGDGVAALDGSDMEPGDLVQFDVRADRNMRMASSPRLVSSDEYPTLAHDLKKAGKLPAANPATHMGRTSAKIVAFEPKPTTPAQKPRQARRAI